MRGCVVRSAVVTVMLGVFACSSSSSDPANEVGPGPDGTCQGEACATSGGPAGPGPTGPACGGSTGTPCGANGGCKTDADCESTCTAGVCGTPNDSDGKKNNGETDVDCGGPNAKKCGVGKTCAASDDCGLGYCPSGTCVAPSPTDKVQNGTETDVDCGGAAQAFGGVTVAAAPACALAAKCGADSDCQSAICADGKRCVEAPSCRPVHGGSTCGVGEVGGAGTVHESCCRTLPVAGLTMADGKGGTKNVYVDKYEITAGRIRAWVAAIKAQNGGVPNIQAWVKARMATDPVLAAMYPGTQSDLLPAKSNNQIKTFNNVSGGGTTDLDLGLQDQIGPSSYYRGVLGNGGTSGCAMYPGSYGHRTYWFDAAESAYFSEIDRGAAAKDVLDEKSMNCMTPLMFGAFCAWDGGYLPTQTAIAAAYGPNQWPWGDTPSPTDEVAKIANYNPGTGGFNNVKTPRYLFPTVDYATFANDFTPIIAAPGRFPNDIASKARPGQESWMDLGGNMIEWSQANGVWYGWTGSSFEGHLYPRNWTTVLNVLDKYGKGGARCMRLQ